MKVFWLVETEYLAMAVATAVAVYSLAPAATERCSRKSRSIFSVLFARA
jgi:hypothetical protein